MKPPGRAPSLPLRLLLGLGAGLVGLALNLFPIDIYGGFYVLFGHGAVVAAAVLLGPLGGLIAGIVASAPTPIVFGHWLTVLIYATEGAVVGLLSRRMLPLPAVLLFWLVGMPLYGILLVSQLPAEYALQLAAKSGIESLVSAVGVQTILVGPAVNNWLRAWLPPPLIRVRLSIVINGLLTLVATLPLLVLTAVQTRILYREAVAKFEFGLEANAAWSSTALDLALDSVVLETGRAARDIAAAGGPSEAQRVLRGLPSRSQSIRGALLLNEAGEVVGRSGRIPPDNPVEQMLGPYLTRRPTLPSLIAVPIDGGHSQLFAIAETRGHLLVVWIDPTPLLENLERMSVPGTQLLLLDSNDSLIGDSTRSVLAPSFRMSVLQAAQQGSAIFRPDDPEARYRPRLAVQLSSATMRQGWHLVVARSRAVIFDSLGGTMGAMTAALAGALLCVAAGSWGLSRMLLGPVLAVSHAAARIESGERGIKAATAGAPRELHALGLDFDHMAAQLEARLEQVERSNRSKDEFLSIASHELKTPITSLKTQIQLLERRLGPEEANRIRLLDRQIDRLNRLVDQLLEASRTGRDELELQLAPMELSTTLRRIVEALSQADPAPVFHLDLDRCYGTWDEIRIEQMLHNLLGNAIKYSPPSSPIDVSLHCGDAEAVIEIADRGIGIDGERKEGLFGRFERGKASAARGLAGLGVGLFLAQTIALRHGGRIELEPREGGGTTARAILPRTSGRA